MNKFTIVGIPDEENLIRFNELKLYFNKGGFRGKVKDVASDAHITLAQGAYESEDDLEKIKNTLQDSLGSFGSFRVAYSKITNERKGPNKKRDYEYNWIALEFDNEELSKLSRAIDVALRKLNVSTTDEYVEMVRNINPDSVGKKFIGDHLNICNYCLPKFADEAYEKVAKEAPKEFMISRVAFRHESGEHAWEIALYVITDDSVLYSLD